MNHDIETKLATLVPTGKSRNRDALFFELGKKHKKQYSLSSVFLAGAIAASFPWLLLTQSQKIETLSPPNPAVLVLIEPVKSEPYSLLSYRKVFESTNDLPSLRLIEAGAQVETLSDIQKEFSLYHQ